jgi:hypothetical protein
MPEGRGELLTPVDVCAVGDQRKGRMIAAKAPMKTFGSILIAVGTVFAVIIVFRLRRVGAALHSGGELVLLGFCLRGIARDTVTPPPSWREWALNVILVVAIGDL